MSNERHVFQSRQMYYGKSHDGKAVIYKVSTIARKSGFITFRKMHNCKPSKEKFRDVIFPDKYGNERVNLGMVEINSRDKVE